MQFFEFVLVRVCLRLLEFAHVLNPKGVPNGVFQTVFFGFLTSACDSGKSLPRDKECLKTPVISSSLVLSAVTDPDHPLTTPL